MGPMWWAHPCEDQKVSLIVEDEFYSKLHLETPSLGCGTKHLAQFYLAQLGKQHHSHSS